MANLLPLTYYPDPLLRQKAEEISLDQIKAEDFRQLVLDMEKTMKEKDGIGLAAPQVGKSIRMVLINTEEGTMVLINPEITYKSWKKETAEEGCLSLPDIFGPVKRPIDIKVSSIDLDGKKVEFEASGLFARVIQHEVDHIDGILFIDKTRKITKGLDKLNEMEKNGKK